jgi:hypothetical protein
MSEPVKTMEKKKLDPKDAKPDPAITYISEHAATKDQAKGK